VAAQIDLVGHRSLAYHLAGISPDLRKRIDTAALIVRGDLELAERLGRSEYSLRRGREHYKFRWRPIEVSATRLVLARPGALPVPYVAAVRLRIVAVRAVKWSLARLRRMRETAPS
jgi:hypothetical protein